MGATESNAKHGKERKGTGKRYTDGFLGFVDIPLSEHDKEALMGWTSEGAVNVADFLVTLMDEGYKFSLSMDVEHHSAIATATGKGDVCPNKGYALSARGPDALAAIVVLWYKLAQLSEWGAWTTDNGNGSRQMDMFR